MKIAFYAPFKPLDHPNPSGDRIIGSGLFRYLSRQGHDLWTASRLRCRWIFWKPWLLPRITAELRRVLRGCDRLGPDLWLTYHTYYKAPDLLGPLAAPKARVPYVIFQGIYATKHRRRFKTRPGFLLNRRALQAARHVFTNRIEDHRNLARIVPPDRLSYVKPGIAPEQFRFDPAARRQLRRQWQVGEIPVLVAAAMFRPGVKSDGLAWLIETCAGLEEDFRLVLVGDGRERNRLCALAEKRLGRRVYFAGRVPRNEMYRYYSAGDLFTFPGIRETLGMVFLEAQSCGLPVVAFDNGGIPEVVRREQTAFLPPPFARGPFVDALQRLLRSVELRRRMGAAAQAYVREAHDLGINYRIVEEILAAVVAANPGGRS